MKKGAYNALKLPYRLALILSAFVAITACEDVYQPKPEGYFRIGLPDTTYQQLQSDCPYTFQLNTDAQFKPKKDCWGDIYYGQIRGTIQLTYKDLKTEGDLDNVLKEAQELAYKHTVAAQGIGEKLYRSAYNAEEYRLVPAREPCNERNRQQIEYGKTDLASGEIISRTHKENEHKAPSEQGYF